MANTLDAVEVGSDWTDLNALSGVNAGSEYDIQVVGAPQDLLEIWFSSTEPDSGQRGEVLKQIDPAKRIAAGEGRLWGRYFIPSRNIDQYTEKKTRVQIRRVLSESLEQTAYNDIQTDAAFATVDLLSSILLELRRLNAYYAEGFGNKLNDEDIER